MNRLIELVRQFKGKRVAVLGDLVADVFIYGEISRISREAPVLVLNQRQTQLVPGGGANAVHNLRTLGATPLPIGIVGDEGGAGLQRIAEGARGILRRVPSGRRQLAFRARNIEIGEANEMHARGSPNLREKHGAELAGSDQSDADRPPGGFALAQLGEEIHGSVS